MRSKALRDDLEAVEFVVKLHVIVHGVLVVLVAQVVVFLDVLEVVLVHSALAVPLAGVIGLPLAKQESLVVLEHQLRVVLVGVNRLSEVDELVVVVVIGLPLCLGKEPAEVYPQAAERAVVVLAVSTAVDGGFAVAGALVVWHLRFG